jgi:hypothetical protein
LPLTCEIGYLRADPGKVLKAFVTWRRRLDPPEKVVIDEIAGPPAELLDALTPLALVIPGRLLVLPTAGAWTALINNYWQGSEITSTLSVMSEKLGVAGVRAVSAIRDGGTTFKLRGSDGEEVRSTWALNDGGRWDVGASGEPQPFEREQRLGPGAAPRVLRRAGPARSTRTSTRRTGVPRSS